MGWSFWYGRSTRCDIEACPVSARRVSRELKKRWRQAEATASNQIVNNSNIRSSKKYARRRCYLSRSCSIRFLCRLLFPSFFFFVILPEYFCTPLLLVSTIPKSFDLQIGAFHLRDMTLSFLPKNRKIFSRKKKEERLETSSLSFPFLRHT